MSWLLIIILVILGLSVIQGLRKGLIRTIVSTFFLIFVMAISIWMAPYIEGVLDKNTKLPEYIEEKCGAFLSERFTNEGDSQTKPAAGDEPEDTNKNLEREQIEKLPLPDYLKDKIADNNTESMYQSLVVNTFGDYVSQRGYPLYYILYDFLYIVCDYNTNNIKSGGYCD